MNTNVPTKYQLPTPYGSDIYSLAKILQVNVTTTNQGHTMAMHTYSPQYVSLLSINCLYLKVPEILP